MPAAAATAAGADDELVSTAAMEDAAARGAGGAEAFAAACRAQLVADAARHFRREGCRSDFKPDAHLLLKSGVLEGLAFHGARTTGPGFEGVVRGGKFFVPGPAPASAAADAARLAQTWRGGAVNWAPELRADGVGYPSLTALTKHVGLRRKAPLEGVYIPQLGASLRDICDAVHAAFAASSDGAGGGGGGGQPLPLPPPPPPPPPQQQQQQPLGLESLSAPHGADDDGAPSPSGGGGGGGSGDDGTGTSSDAASGSAGTDERDESEQEGEDEEQLEDEEEELEQEQEEEEEEEQEEEEESKEGDEEQEQLEEEGDEEEGEEEREERPAKRRRPDGAAAAAASLETYAMAIAWSARQRRQAKVTPADLFASGALAGGKFTFSFKGRWRAGGGGGDDAGSGGGGDGDGGGDSVFVTVSGVVERAGFAVRAITLRERPGGAVVTAIGAGDRLVPRDYKSLVAASGFARVDTKHSDPFAAVRLPEIGERGATLAELVAAAQRKLGPA